MNKTVRKIAWILAHVGVLLSILYLVFFLVISIRTANAERNAENEQDVYLVQAMHERDFSVYNVGKALSEDSDPVRENVFIAADLVVPVLCLSSGILLQIAATRTHRKHTAKPIQPIEPTNHRR